MKGFAGQNLQAGEVNFVPAIQRDVFLREIFADAADKFYRRKKTRRDRRMAGRAAEQARVSLVGVLMESSAVVPTMRTLMIFS